MDITAPRLTEQAAPAPWLWARMQQPVEKLVDHLLRENPQMTVQQLVSRLASTGIQVPGVWAACWLRQAKMAQDTDHLKPVGAGSNA